MRDIQNQVSPFDHDFEVTYEEEIPFTYHFDTEPTPNVVPKAAARPVHRPNRRKTPRLDETIVQDYAPDYEDDYADIYDDDLPRYTPKKVTVRKKPSMVSPRVFSRPKKASSYGTKSIYRVARIVVRIVSILIGAGTLGTLVYNFWRGAAPYGDPVQLFFGGNLTLLSYAAVAFLFILFECIAFLWSLTKMKIRDGRKVYREDTGRGLSSFIFLYLASYVSFLICSVLPEQLGTIEILNGLRGGLDVFGSMHNTLLGLCLAGVISCLVRKRMNPI